MNVKSEEQYLQLLKKLEEDDKSNNIEGFKAIFHSLNLFPKLTREYILPIMKATLYKK